MPKMQGMMFYGIITRQAVWDDYVRNWCLPLFKDQKSDAPIYRRTDSLTHRLPTN